MEISSTESLIKFIAILNYIFKEPRKCILCIISVWSLFYLLRIYIRLHFLPIPFKKLVFCFSVFCALCMICFELEVVFIDIL